METAQIIHSERFKGISTQDAIVKRDEAKDTADQFEAIFLQQMVVKMRESASLGEGGMFGDGPGSNTYSAWFDSNMSKAISGSGQVGISNVLMAEFERLGAIPSAEQEGEGRARTGIDNDKQGRTDVFA